MHDNSDYGKGLAEIFQNRIELGGEVTNFEGVQVGDTDFRAALAKVGANAPEFIFFGGYSTEAGLIAQQMKETPGLDGALFMSDDGSYTQQYLEAAGDTAEGTYMSFVAGATNEAALEAFAAKYMAEFGKDGAERSWPLPRPELRLGDDYRCGHQGRCCEGRRQSGHRSGRTGQRLSAACLAWTVSPVWFVQRNR